MRQTEELVEKLPQGADTGPAFKTTRSAAEMAMLDAEGYASEGYAEHKGGKHLEEHWHKGYGGLRQGGEDSEEERERLHELEAHKHGGEPSLLQRAKQAVSSMGATVVGMSPGGFKTTKSAAELAYDNAEGYADEGGKHLEEHWHKGYGGLRQGGEDSEEERERLHDLEARAQPGTAAGMVQSVKETVASTAAAATEKANELLQAAKESVGMGPK